MVLEVDNVASSRDADSVNQLQSVDAIILFQHRDRVVKPEHGTVVLSQCHVLG